ncbi:MAG: hypothetical protein K8T91_07800 [Planctomycetes bacterium]|nr:hypothetical protein [Planctomycetota bacterium]
MSRFSTALFTCSLAAALLTGCSEMAPLSKQALPTHTPQPTAVPEWPPNYEGRKPWNRNPETPKDNHAYKIKGERINVIGADGPLFVDEVGGQLVDWPKPKLALLLSGAMQGYIEPCGCAGLENMKGGLSRRHTLIDELKQAGWPLVLLDQGELTHRVGPQATIKYQRTIDGLRTMGYRTIGLGTSDLRLMASDLLATLPGDGATHYVSANVGLMGLDNDFTAPFRVIEEGGMKIGVTSVALPPKDQPLQNADVAVVSPAEGLKKVVPQLVAKKCDQLVLLVAPCATAGQGELEDSVTRKAAEDLARQFPQFNLMVIATNEDPPSKDLKAVAGTPTKLVELSHKSMYVGVVNFYDDQARPVRYQRVPLDARFEASTDMKQLMVTYQDQLREEGFARLGVLPRQHSQKATFVGSQACADCHTKAFAIWEKTPHAHALDTLDKATPPRMHDPECLSCHVTGWDAKAYVPFVSGFESKQKTPHLAGNGCENCHGPGSAHVAAENGDNKALQKQLQAQMRLTLAEADNLNSTRSCRRCHDIDNSPDFGKKGFQHYWQNVEHKGKD